ncbi:DUF4381 domain-containing protein [Vibrio hangzhouensis]|uniref:DUF4381 domain-containing protein n=1 Tax=Vibrio hangzhouensis TaxID=462991 RepID=A0A1H5X6P0_9VIBR|nr:DUF4381 domain-containing protein [Vibrio hangzhouensis]SEG07050.1 protein of unknown function [Vibrio hangzhouensis]
MSKNNILLNDLIDPVTPEAIRFFPETIGWKMVAVVLLVTSAMLLFRTIHRYRSNRYRRIALKAIGALSKSHAGNYLIALNSVLKQVACHRYPFSSVASLHGEQWLVFLSNKIPEPGFASTIAHQWQQNLYTANSDINWTPTELRQLESLVCDWIRNHR